MPLSRPAFGLTLCLFALAACGTARISYSPLPGVHISAPIRIPAKPRARLPNGRGGHSKIGAPYRVNGRVYYPLATARGYDETGIASWYGRDFHGKLTANGERYDMHALSAAHRTLPLPSLVRVTNLENGRSVIVRVNDRGPFVKNRLIDLSWAAAKALGFADKGTALVRVQALDTKTSPSGTVARVSAPARVGARIRSAAGMYVQVGAFGQRKHAYRLQATLSRRFPSVRVQRYAQGQQSLYRVRIGPFAHIKAIERRCSRCSVSAMATPWS
jgi:rare lipoprotein A